MPNDVIRQNPLPNDIIRQLTGLGITYIYIYISVVTESTKIRDISDSDTFRPSIVFRPPFHADHFGLNGLKIKACRPSLGSV